MRPSCGRAPGSAQDPLNPEHLQSPHGRVRERRLPPYPIPPTSLVASLLFLLQTITSESSLCVLFSLADEMTVGKVYAALMIFDFYKQNKTTRDQIHQVPGGLSQVKL